MTHCYIILFTQTLSGVQYRSSCYDEDFEEFCNVLRKEFKNPDLPFSILLNPGPSYINTAKRICSKINNIYPLFNEMNNCHGHHFSAVQQRQIGRAFAEKMIPLLP